MNIVHGHSKDHRPDLKQFLVKMLCVDRTIPVFGQTEDGNASDKVINNKVLSSISKYMAENRIKKEGFIYIADSAMVTQKNLEKIGDEIQFISRLPANYKESSRLIKSAIEKEEWVELGKLSDTMETTKRPAAVYKAWESTAVLHNKNYRAVVIHSSAHDKRRQKRIERELKKAHTGLSKKIKKISKQEFFCQADALKAAAEIKKAERIEVLGLVLLLSLLIWRLIEYNMRRYAKDNKKDLPGWVKRRTYKPTAFMLSISRWLIYLNKPRRSGKQEFTF